MSNEELHLHSGHADEATARYNVSDIEAAKAEAAAWHTELLDKTARLLTIREGLAGLTAKVDAALAEPIGPK